jgi:hypothetical protein
MLNMKVWKKFKKKRSYELPQKDILEPSQHESDSIKLFENDKDDETESEEEEPSQGNGNEGWENILNDHNRMEEEFQEYFRG